MQSPGQPPSDPDGISRRVLDAIRLIVRELRESSTSVERRHGLSAAQLFVLRAIVASGPHSVGELARLTLTHQSSVSVVVAKLEKAGLVKRARSVRDARSVTLSATARGRRLAAGGPDPFQDRLVAGLAALRSVDRLQLAGQLERWIQAMGLAERRPGMFFEDQPRPRSHRG